MIPKTIICVVARQPFKSNETKRNEMLNKGNDAFYTEWKMAQAFRYRCVYFFFR